MAEIDPAELGRELLDGVLGERIIYSLHPIWNRPELVHVRALKDFCAASAEGDLLTAVREARRKLAGELDRKQAREATARQEGQA